MHPIPHRHTTGLTRREILQVGYSGLLGIGLTGLLAKQARAADGRARDGPSPSCWSSSPAAPAISTRST